jgi:hypothetical protein
LLESTIRELFQLDHIPLGQYAVNHLPMQAFPVGCLLAVQFG